MDIAELHDRACQQFAARVDRVGDDQWEQPTPCADWNVRMLVNHVVVEDLWTPPIMAGRTIAEVGDQFDGDVLGGDPVKVCQQAARGAVEAVHQPGAMQRTVHLSFGDVPGAEYAWQLFADHLIHAWDLAQAIGADDRLDPDLVDACAGWFAEQEAGYRAAGVIGARVAVPADADPQARLLAAFGRRGGA